MCPSCVSAAFHLLGYEFLSLWRESEDHGSHYCQQEYADERTVEDPCEGDDKQRPYEAQYAAYQRYTEGKDVCHERYNLEQRLGYAQYTTQTGDDKQNAYYAEHPCEHAVALVLLGKHLVGVCTPWRITESCLPFLAV